MTDAFVQEVSIGVRRALFTRLKGRGFTQDELTSLVATAAKAVVDKSYVADLAAIVAAPGELRDWAPDPEPEDTDGDGVITRYDQARANARQRVRDLLLAGGA